MELKNALAYYDMTTIIAVISFKLQASGVVFTTLLFLKLTNGPSVPERLFAKSLYSLV
jgi:hypothetical protein